MIFFKFIILLFYIEFTYIFMLQKTSMCTMFRILLLIYIYIYIYI